MMAVNLNSNDPFEVLDLSPTADKKVIKRAYKRLALKYHPDMVTNQSSTAEEKKKAGDNFSKINWAYQQLNGKGSSSTSSASASSASTASSMGYQPPHRRTTRNPSTSSTDWRDYIPNYEDDEEYDTGGDSFGQIFSDFVVGVASGSSGGGGVFRDFVEFLESSVDGYSSSSDDDIELRDLLRTGTVEDVGNEMDDTELIVQQLLTKADKIRDELFDLQADRKMCTRYVEKMDLDERIAELEARGKIVTGYVKQARTRLESLQMRYKELIVGGESDRQTTTRRTSTDNNYDEDNYNRSSSYSSSYSSSSSASSGSSTSSPSSGEDSWKYEGFGSSRRRGSSSRRRRSRPASAQPSSNSDSSEGRGSNVSPPPGYEDRKNTRTRTTTTTRTSSYSSRSPPGYEERKKSRTKNSSSEPPHRRTSSSSTFNDKRRLQEIKVDEEFEKLKRDLGL